MADSSSDPSSACPSNCSNNEEMDCNSNAGNGRHSRFTDPNLRCDDHLCNNNDSDNTPSSSSGGHKKTECFLAIRIYDEDVVQNVTILQQLIKAESPDAGKFMVDPAAFHITVLTRIQIDLEDKEDIARAKATLEKAITAHWKEVKESNVEADMQGVTTFYGTESEGRVIISEVEGEAMNAQLKALHDCADKEFKAMNMLSESAMTEVGFPYIAHMTIGIVPRGNDFKFDECSWKDYEDTIFGVQPLTTVDILTHKGNHEAGPYRCVAQVELCRCSNNEGDGEEEE